MRCRALTHEALLAVAAEQRVRAHQPDLLGPSGEQMTELNGAGQWVHTNVTANGSLIATFDNDNKGAHFTLTDWLGTKRVQTNYLGAVEESCQSLPFGDGLSCWGPAVDATEHHFTGKERDKESGLDYFGARYYSSNMGRFTIPDWSAKEEPVPYAKLDDPQSLNLYSYARNSPLDSNDPDGHTTYYDSKGNVTKDDGKNNGVVVVQPDGSAPQITFSRDEGIAIQDSIARTNQEPKGHEEGFVEDASGSISNSPPGKGYASDDKEAILNQTLPPGAKMEEHTHPADIKNPAGTFGKSVSYQEKPSYEDKTAAAKTPSVVHVEASAKNENVYIYNGKNIIAQLPLSAFPKHKDIPNHCPANNGKTTCDSP